MKKRKNKGFVLVLVTVLIALTGIIMAFLTSTSNSMLFHSNKNYLRACERNMIASALAWSETNIQKDSGDISGKMIELDVTEMDIRGSKLVVNLSSPDKTPPQVRIGTSCSLGRNNLTSDKTYKIRQ
ncbi:MAG: hypothetical protein JW715_10370 [Sedimentisphaerales bacterium]|nr:hypothetical protein [Sedimentisphaerales bacterium]